MVKIYDAYEYEQKRFMSANGLMRRLALRMQRVSGAGTPLTHFVSMCAVSIVVVVALLQAQHGMLTLGEFITFLSALLLLLTPIRHLSSLNGATARVRVAAESIFEMLDELEEKDPGENELKRVRGDVRFEGVTRQYAGAEKPSVKDFSLDVKAGETVALVGASGAGKTTLINLIPRFWTPTAGEIYFDGVAQSSVTLKSLRDQISLVSQDVILFDDTIAANIAYGNKNATRDQIEEAARAAYLMPFIETLPKGLDTQVQPILAGYGFQLQHAAQIFIQFGDIVRNVFIMTFYSLVHHISFRRRAEHLVYGQVERTYAVSLFEGKTMVAGSFTYHVHRCTFAFCNLVYMFDGFFVNQQTHTFL